MISYDLERKNKKGNWIKYCTFTDLSNFDTLIIELSEQNYLTKNTDYRVVMTVSSNVILFGGPILDLFSKGGVSG